jgi:hypothetical protein
VRFWGGFSSLRSFWQRQQGAVEGLDIVAGDGEGQRRTAAAHGGVVAAHVGRYVG